MEGNLCYGSSSSIYRNWLSGRYTEIDLCKFYGTSRPAGDKARLIRGFNVIPAQVGIQRDWQLFLDSGLRRRNDGKIWQCD